jgi:hypothetical protein
VTGGLVNNRLEAHTRGTDLLPGLQARVRDALWLLARQRQLGELDGRDAGTPIAAALVTRHEPLVSWTPDGGAVRGYDGAVPLEALVESGGGPVAWRDRVAAGLRLTRTLRRAGVDPSALIAAHPLGVPDAAVAPDANAAAHATSAVTPDEVNAAGAVTAGRVPDAVAVAAAYDAGADALVAAAGGEVGRPVLFDRRAWWATRQPLAPGAWQPQQLSYSLSAATADPSLPVYRAARFDGGGLEWHDFDVSPGTGGSPPADAAPPPPTRAVPVPITFHGAPVGRYWQLDDARTDLGALDTYPTELAKLLLAEFTACFAGDWFRLPARVPFGSAVKIEALVSTDTFGVATLVPSAAAASGSRPWRMYEHGADGDADGSWLLLPSELTARLDSAPLEEVVLARDPAADLVWGVERVVENAVGRPIRRSEDLRIQGRVTAPDPREGLPDAWVWRLATSVPENWIPFLPTRGRAENDDYLLVEASMIRYTAGAGGAPTAVPIIPAGVLLRGVGTLPEREVPREGRSLQRARTVARWVDGSRVRWTSARVSVGHGEASSGLAYDGLHVTSEDQRAIGQ